MPLSTELHEALARARRRPQLRDRSVNQMDGARTPLLQEPNDSVLAEDPDDVIDPDDSGPRLSVTLKEYSVDEIFALKAAQAEQTRGPSPYWRSIRSATIASYSASSGG